MPQSTTRPLSTVRLWLAAVAIGVATGFAAVVFHWVIGFFHNLLLLGKVSIHYDADQHTAASPWGPPMILVPVIGAAAVIFLLRLLGPAGEGRGVSEVLDAVHYRGGVIRMFSAGIKSLAAAISIGSGGSIGREGPIIQIGSSFGSTLGRWLPVPRWQRMTMIAAGAGGGIAATFDMPVGGILFAVELILQELSVRTLVPVAIGSVVAAQVGRAFFGPHPAIAGLAPGGPAPGFGRPLVLVVFAVLGLVGGLVSAAFIKSVFRMEDLLKRRIPGGPYVRHMLGMLPVGVMMYLMMAGTGHYYIEGIGYATMRDILADLLASPGLLAVLFAAKLLSTSLTLGSGAPGGVFSPCLFLGATIGALYGVGLSALFPSLGVPVPAYATAGMAAVLGGSTGAAVAAVVMLFELTLDYNVIIPLTIAVALSYGVRAALVPESIYTAGLARRGHPIPQALRKRRRKRPGPR